MSDKIRVTIFANGDYTSGGKVLVLENIQNLQELMTRAQAKLGAEQPFKRVFVDSGAEVTDIEDILGDDKLYFSTGPDFIHMSELSPALPSSSDDMKSDDAEKKQFLQNIALAAVTQAALLYDSTSTYVKNKSPEFVKVTLEKVEGTVAAVGNPLYTKVVEYGTPAINWADEKIDSAYDRVRRRSLQFIQSDFAKTVNNVLQPIKQRIQQPEQISSEISAFYHAAVDQFQSLDKTGTGRVSYDDFIAGLRVKLGSAWNEKLVEPAKSFYAQVQSEYESTVQKVSDKTEESKIQAITIFNNAKTKLGKTWENAIQQHFKPTQQQIIELFHTRVTQPAEAFYSSAWASYLALGGVDGRPVTSAEFLAGLRMKLGMLWNDKLVAPAQHLYESFRTEYQAQQQAQAQAQAQEQANNNNNNNVVNVSMDDIESELAAELTKIK